MGSKVTITTDVQYKEQCDMERIWLDYVNITKVIKANDLIYIDDGLVSLKVLEIVDDKSKCFFSFPLHLMRLFEKNIYSPMDLSPPLNNKPSPPSSSSRNRSCQHRRHQQQKGSQSPQR